jgi:hypothetical protein
MEQAKRDFNAINKQIADLKKVLGCKSGATTTPRLPTVNKPKRAASIASLQTHTPNTLQKNNNKNRPSRTRPS